MERTISATEARVHFGELMRDVVEHGETVIVERGGKPQVVVISVSDYKRLRNGDADRSEVQARLKEFHERLRAHYGDRILSPSVDEIIQQGRDERDRELDFLMR